MLTKVGTRQAAHTYGIAVMLVVRLQAEQNLVALCKRTQHLSSLAIRGARTADSVTSQLLCCARHSASQHNDRSDIVHPDQSFGLGARQSRTWSPCASQLSACPLWPNVVPALRIPSQVSPCAAPGTVHPNTMTAVTLYTLTNRGEQNLVALCKRAQRLPSLPKHGACTADTIACQALCCTRHCASQHNDSSDIIHPDRLFGLGARLSRTWSSCASGLSACPLWPNMVPALQTPSHVRLCAAPGTVHPNTMTAVTSYTLTGCLALAPGLAEARRAAHTQLQLCVTS